MYIATSLNRNFTLSMHVVQSALAPKQSAQSVSNLQVGSRVELIKINK